MDDKCQNAVCECICKRCVHHRNFPKCFNWCAIGRKQKPKQCICLGKKSRITDSSTTSLHSAITSLQSCATSQQFCATSQQPCATSPQYATTIQQSATTSQQYCATSLVSVSAGSPFHVGIKQPLNPAKVRCYGPGLDSTKVKAGKPATFTVDTTEAGEAPIDVSFTDSTR